MLSAILAGVAVEVLKRLAGQVEVAARGRKGRPASQEIKLAEHLRAFDPSKSVLMAAVDMPADFDARNFEAFCKTPEVHGIAFELTIFLLAEASPRLRQRILDDWSRRATVSLRVSQRTSGQLFNVLEGCLRSSLAAVKVESPEAYERVKSHSQTERIACVLDSILARLDRGDSTCSLESADSFVESYRAQLRNAHRSITPPDFDRRRDIDIDDIYVSPTITTRHGEGSAPQPVGDLMETLDRSVLLGDPGNGKSTASQVLVHRAARDGGGPIPFLVVLKDFAATHIERSIVDYLYHHVSTYYQCPADPGIIEYLLESGRCVVVFDGLDELLDTSYRRRVTEVVSLFSNRYPLARILVTSRRVGYQQAPMNARQFQVFELSGFDRDQVRAYVEKWFGQEELSDTERATWTNSFMNESEQVSDLTVTPLLLALMCIIYRGERSIPRNRPAVYERCANMLFDKWDSSRGIHSDLRVGQLVDPAMKHLAFWLFTQKDGGSDGVTEDALIAETTRYLHERSIENEDDARAAAVQFVEFCRGRAWVFSDVGTTSDGDRLYKFTHRTFLEYFAAYHLSRKESSPEKLARLLAPRVANAEWDVVAQLAIQISDKHTDRAAIRIFDALLNEKRRRAPNKRINVLSFLGRCLSFVQVSPLILRTLTSQGVELVVDEDRSTPTSVDVLGTVLTYAHHVDDAVIESELSLSLNKAMTQSLDSNRRWRAFSLVAFGESLLHHTRLSETPSSIVRERWESSFREIATPHRESFIELAVDDLHIGWFCVRNNWLTLSQLLDRLGRRLTPIFQSYPVKCTPIVYVEFAYEMLTAGLYKPGNSRQDTLGARLRAVEEVATYAERLIRDGEALSDAAAPILGLHLGDGRELFDSISGQIASGLSVILACGYEMGGDFTDMQGAVWGEMREVIDVMPSRPLPVERQPGFAREEPFSLFSRWLAGDLQFVGPRVALTV